MDFFLLLTPPLLLLTMILLYRNLWIVNHLCCKLSSELQVALLGISRKRLVCLLRVEASDPQDESKDSIWPITCLPSFLDCNRLHGVVVIVVVIVGGCCCCWWLLLTVAVIVVVIVGGCCCCWQLLAVVVNQMPMLVVVGEDLCVTEAMYLLVSFGLVKNPVFTAPSSFTVL
jgi:hypothetical protein